MLVLLCVLAVSVLLQSLVAESVVSTGGTVYSTTEAGLNNTVVLGALFPVHFSGTNQPCGQVSPLSIQLVESMVLATRLINEDPELLPGVALAFDIRDTCRSINYALQQSIDYIQSGGNCSEQLGLGPSGILGPFLSTISEAAANLFGLFEIPQVSYGSSATLLSEERFSYFFRTIPSDRYQAMVLADIVVEYGWEFIILLHSNDLYGMGGIRAFREEFERQRNYTSFEGCIAVQIALSDNYEAAVDQMNQDGIRNASVVLLFGHLDNAVGIFREIAVRVMKDPNFPLQNLTWIGSDSWGDNLPEMYRPMARGMISTVPQTEVIQEFDDYFTSLNPANNTVNPWFIEYWENEFECNVNLSLSQGLEDCDLNNQAISLSTTNYSQFSLVPLVFDAVYVLAHSVQNLITSRCPKGDLCSDIVANGVVIGSLLRESILSVTLPSQSQANTELSFDSNGDVEGMYSVLNLQSTSNNQYTYVKVGSWDVQNSLSIQSDIEWVGGNQVPETSCSQPCAEGEIRVPITSTLRLPTCCFGCSRCPPGTATNATSGRCFRCNSIPGMEPNENRTDCVEIPITFLAWSNPWAIALAFITSIGVLTTTIVIIIFLIFYKHELIKASSRELSAILLLGLLLCYMMPFFYIAKPSAAICAIRRFGVGFCFAIPYSALLVKTNRIYRIFSRNPNSSAKQLRFISPLSQVLITAAFLSVQVVIGIMWLAIELPATKVVASSTRNELTCASRPEIGVIVSLAYNFLLLILCTYFAILTRKVPANFNEAKFINVTMYSTGLIWLVFIPSFFATSMLGTVFQTTTLVFGIIFSATTALCCLFISKVILLSSRIRKQRTENSYQSHSGSAFSSKHLSTTANATTPKSIEMESSVLKSADDKTE